MMMLLEAAEFEADIRQISCYSIALETCIAISDNSCILLLNTSMNKVSIP